MCRKLWAGVDIGGTKTAIVLSSKPPEVLSRIEFPTLPAKGHEPAVARIKSALHEMLAKAGAGMEALAGIGVSCGGPLNSRRGVIQAPPNLSTWIDVPIVEILAAEFQCPTYLENDANAGAMAEHRFGAGKGARNLVFLTMGTGLGAGIILNNKVYSGSNGMAGEIGHVRLTADGPEGYHKKGSAEGWASGGGMAQVAARMVAEALKNGEQSMLLNVPAGRAITAKDVGVAAVEGDALARRIVTLCGEKLGMALAILVDVLNPERIVIGGLAMRLGDLLLDPARKSLSEEALAPSLSVCKVMPAALGESIGDTAALCVAMQAAEHSSSTAEESI